MTERVLIVDDEKEFLDTMAERMKLRGMEVATAESPTEALKIIEKENFDAIILDLMMPEMDGLTTLSKMKEKKADAQVILLTGHATLEKGIEAMKLGAMDFLEKPIDLKALTDKIKKAQARKMIIVEKRTEEKLKEIMGKKCW